MKNIILSILLLVALLSCTDNKKKGSEETPNVINNQHTPQNISVKQNYAVVFKWSTQDEKLVEANAMQQADQLLAMWKNNTVENVYFDSEAKVDKLSYFPNITFVINAANAQQAETKLNELIVVKKGIATYKIFPIGNLWLKRNTEAIHKRGVTKSYVTVWATNSKPEDEITQKQSNAVLELWKSGIIENVYFDIEGTQINNDKTDFVFYVNANSEEEVKSLLKDLPFYKAGIASYTLYQVGVFWMGLNH